MPQIYPTAGVAERSNAVALRHPFFERKRARKESVGASEPFSERKHRFESCRRRTPFLLGKESVYGKKNSFKRKRKDRFQKENLFENCGGGGAVKRASLESWFLHGSASSNLVLRAFFLLKNRVAYGFL